MADKKLQVVLATTNKGKIRELSGPLGALGAEVLGLDQFPEIGDIVEDGATFAENALIKAKTVAERTGLISIADDSGLEVDALDGAPGIYSARFSNDWESLPGESRDMRNNRKLLHVLKDVPEEKRGAQFVCCMVAVRPGHAAPEEILSVRGEWRGRILKENDGANGFGYDPIFLDPEVGVSTARLTQEQKTARSHRGKALKALIAGWQTWLAQNR